MGANIHSLGDTSPELLLDMIKANIPNIKNVVVSVVFGSDDGNECQTTYYSKMNTGDLAYHCVAVDAYLKNIILVDDD